MTITAKFPGRCSCCGNAISPGAKMTKIATCYNPTLAPGSRRLIEIRLDNTTLDYNLAHVHNHVVEYAEAAKTERQALGLAAAHGYTDVVYGK